MKVRPTIPGTEAPVAPDSEKHGLTTQTSKGAAVLGAITADRFAVNAPTVSAGLTSGPEAATRAAGDEAGLLSAHELVQVRAAETEATSESPGAPSLDQILDYLYEPHEHARALVTGLRDWLVSRGARLDGEVAHPLLEDESHPVPKDPFAANLTRFLYGSFLRHIEIRPALPQAVVWALAHAADDDGRVTPEKARKLFGRHAQALVGEVQRGLAERPLSAVATRSQLKSRWLPIELANRIAGTSTRAAALSERMPAIAKMVEHLGGAGKLSDYRLFASGLHLFWNSVEMLAGLQSCGIEPHKARLVGKSYSACVDVIHYLKNSKWNADLTVTLENVPAAELQGMRLSQTRAYLADQFAHVDPNDANAEPVLILDDGGHAIDILHREFPEYAHLCVAVEQTDRGIQLIEKLKADGIELQCPVVNVARSWAKKVVEGPMIGEGVADSVEVCLQALGDVTIEPKVATVIGFGAVGSETAKALRRRGYEVHVYDKKLDDDTEEARAMRQAIADSGCVEGRREEVLKKAHLLVSATGQTTITADEYDLLPDGAVLANAGSGNHELGMHERFAAAGFLSDDPNETASEDGMRQSVFRGKDVVLGDIAAVDANFHRVMRSPSGKEHLVLRNGYVVNMAHGTPPEYIQLTLALLVAGCLKAVTLDKPGLVDLDDSSPDHPDADSVQHFAVDEVRAYLDSIGLQIERPDFSSLRY